MKNPISGCTSTSDSVVSVCDSQGPGPGDLLLFGWQCHSRGDRGGQEEPGQHRPGAGSIRSRPAGRPGGPPAGGRSGRGLLPAGHRGEDTVPGAHTCSYI